MRRIAVLALVCALSGLAASGERGSRTLSGWLNVTADNGWRGRRYMDGDQIFAEEFASGGAGRIDVWRFYRRGVLTSEERDLNGDGKVDFQTRWDPRNGLLASVLRDTTMRGVNDLEIERVNHDRWEIREDRNLDGVTDRILFVSAPNTTFDSLGGGLATQGDIVGLVPREGWREMWSDDGYTGRITDYFRYNSGGVLSYYGQWDGRRIDWRRCSPDFVPPTGAASAPPPAFVAPPAAPVPQQLPPAAYPGDPDAAVRDPFNLSEGALDADPYAGFDAPQAPRYAERPQHGQSAVPPPAAPQMSRLPTDESFARSVPARMRPPGAATRRPPRF